MPMKRKYEFLQEVCSEDAASIWDQTCGDSGKMTDLLSQRFVDCNTCSSQQHIDDDDEDEEEESGREYFCVICQETDFDMSNKVSLTCRHMFHASCFKRLLEHVLHDEQESLVPPTCPHPGCSTIVGYNIQALLLIYADDEQAQRLLKAYHSKKSKYDAWKLGHLPCLSPCCQAVSRLVLIGHAASEATVKCDSCMATYCAACSMASGSLVPSHILVDCEQRVLTEEGLRALDQVYDATGDELRRMRLRDPPAALRRYPRPPPAARDPRPPTVDGSQTHVAAADSRTQEVEAQGTEQEDRGAEAQQDPRLRARLLWMDLYRGEDRLEGEERLELHEHVRWRMRRFEEEGDYVDEELQQTMQGMRDRLSSIKRREELEISAISRQLHARPADKVAVELLDARLRIVEQKRELFESTRQTLEGMIRNPAVEDPQHHAPPEATTSLSLQDIHSMCDKAFLTSLKARISRIASGKEREEARAEARSDQEEIARTSKPCTKCGYRIVKMGGCDHMTCRKCRHEFCWRCLKPTIDHFHSSCQGKPDLLSFSEELQPAIKDVIDKYRGVESPIESSLVEYAHRHLAPGQPVDEDRKRADSQRISAMLERREPFMLRYFDPREVRRRAEMRRLQDMQREVEQERIACSFVLRQVRDSSRSPISKDAALRVCSDPSKQYLKYRAAKRSLLDAQEKMRRETREAPVDYVERQRRMIDCQCHVIDVDLARLEMQKQACVLMGMDVPPWLLSCSERLSDAKEQQAQDISQAVCTRTFLDAHRDYMLSRMSQRVEPRVLEW
ncbi:hypothetical protein GUITHDRAFT_122687 [Guillardia theta CCMP2712]|uniref:RBR-type E3 ubiquitin transferase n=1 Tax=Guillardia theta (strain CCMP2712) TaxID=905079 RepID=L1I4D7_GUITC|nr:hypothetical protein GUITHDRAFT_122687 [Guillardia theta CCMP2712]EKX31106.1 hypothetical protein GUITHDRAFT_122687 [Guillardia theta CCMP2712]|eukprot:XP_005818086.1 hypothetical protein GUITHDRAFT_122687 [Guillardia theta CCMP2712]